MNGWMKKMTAGQVEHLKTKKEMQAQNLTKEQVEDYAFATAHVYGTNLHAMSIEHGINDSMIYAINIWSSTEPVYFKKRIYYTDNDAYVLYCGWRVKLSEFIRKM